MKLGSTSSKIDGLEGQTSTTPPISKGVFSFNSRNIIREMTFKNCWGEHQVIDARFCDNDLITNPEYLTKWVKDLVQTINMVAFGEPFVVHFGKNDPKLAGWTVVQLIETSNIVAHFNDLDGSACIDVFSCAPFSEKVVKEQIKKWFGDKVVLDSKKITRLPN